MKQSMKNKELIAISNISSFSSNVSLLLLHMPKTMYTSSRVLVYRSSSSFLSCLLLLLMSMPKNRYAPSRGFATPS